MASSRSPRLPQVPASPTPRSYSGGPQTLGFSQWVLICEDGMPSQKACACAPSLLIQVVMPCRQVCNDAAAILFMFDLTRIQTLANVKEWYRQVGQQV